MRTFPKGWTLGISSVALLGVFALFLAPQVRNPATVAHASSAAAPAVHAPAVSQFKIVPADVLAPVWTSTVGDHSN
jgi:hypothetical protein